MIKFVSQKFRDSAAASQMLVSKSWIWEVSIANWLSSSQAFLFLLPTCHSPKIFIAHLFTEWVDFGTEFFIMSNISSAALFDSRKIQCDLSWTSHTNSFVQHKIKNLTLAYSLQIFALKLCNKLAVWVFFIFWLFWPIFSQGYPFQRGWFEWGTDEKKNKNKTIT